MKTSFDDLVYTKETIEFITVSNEFCIFVEQSKQFSKQDFLEKSQKILSLLYLKASMLPYFQEVFDESPEYFVTEDMYNTVREILMNKFGETETYFDIFEQARQEGDQTVNVSLSECFADIYQDLKNITSVFQVSSPESINDALFQCKTNFEQYWGIRVLGALSSIHTIIYGDPNLLKETVKKEEENNNGDDDDYATNLIEQLFKKNKN